MGNGQTSLTQNANENPTMAAAAAQATTPVMPTSGPGAGQVPLWASGPAGVRYPEQNNAMVQSAVDVQKQNLAGQQQQFNQGTAAQTQAQNNVVFQQNQSVQQALLDPTSPVNVASRQYLASIGINLPDSVSMAQMEKVSPGIIEKVLSTSGMQTYNNNMAQTAAAYDANPQGYDTAVGAAGDDLNLVENKIRKLQGNNDWSQRKMAIALTAVSQPNNKDAQLAAAAIDPDYLDIAHTAQVIGANYGMVSGKGTDFGTQTVMNSILNPADPIKSLEVTRAAITSARDNAKNISKEYHKTGGRFGGFTPTTVNPYANVPAEKQKAEVGNNAVGNNTTTPANRINIQDKNGHTFSIPNKPSQIALAQKQGYTIAPGQ